jgi:transposase-like protein
MMDGAAQVGLAVDGAVRRKRFSLEQKQQIIRAAFEPGALVARVAREYGLNANQVFKWMKLRERGLLIDRPRQGAGLLPVRITGPRRRLCRLLLRHELDRSTSRLQAIQCLP